VIPTAAVVADPPALPPSPDQKPVLDGQHWPFPDERYQLTPFLGYTLFGGVDVTGGTLRIEDTIIYGIVFDARVRGMALVEVEYRRMSSDLVFERSFAPTTKVFGLDANYLDVGAQVELLPGIVRPYAGISAGLTLINPHAAVDDEVRFSLAFEGGVKVVFSKHVGVRAQARLTTTFFSDTSTIFCGNSGCAVGVGGAGLLQGDFGLGAVASW
jgi:Outer membrane protein beta-barrel domain